MLKSPVVEAIAVDCGMGEGRRIGIRGRCSREEEVLVSVAAGLRVDFCLFRRLVSNNVLPSRDCGTYSSIIS